jgi:ATP-dependent DNA ligase
VAGDGSEGIQAVFEARHQWGSPMAFAAFDVLEPDGHSALAEPWTARRKRLEDLLEVPPPGVCLVPVTENAPVLWDTWVGMGGEGIVLKERTSVYRPGIRSPAWLKLKPKLTLEVVVTGGSAERIRWGDWGEAAMLAFRYTHPRTGAAVEIRQAVRVPRDLPFDLTIGARLALVCWGVMPSGMLRHPVLLRPIC